MITVGMILLLIDMGAAYAVRHIVLLYPDLLDAYATKGIVMAFAGMLALNACYIIWVLRSRLTGPRR